MITLDCEIEANPYAQIPIVELAARLPSRYAAGEILRRVADLGSDGLFPEGVTIEMVGRSLRRIVSNSSESQPLAKLADAILTEPEY